MSILLSILILGLVIFIHELGHFLVAKAVKAPVYKFAIGIGPIMVAKEINGTEYSIRWIPLGGFVQLELEEELESEAESAFRKLSRFKKGSVYFAGALFNFIFAFILIFGISFASGYPSSTVGYIKNNSPAEKQGIQSGDTILSVNNKKISDWNEIHEMITQSEGKELLLKIKRDNNEKVIKVKPEIGESSEGYVIGIAPEYKKDFKKAIVSGAKSTILNIKNTFEGVGEAFSGMFKSKEESNVELSGPIGTIHIISEQAKQGLLPSLMMMISVTISLGVFNLLPIPGLDGGKIFLLLIELIRGGKQFSTEQEIKITMIGVFSLLALMMFTTWNDIIKLF